MRILRCFTIAKLGIVLLVMIYTIYQENYFISLGLIECAPENYSSPILSLIKESSALIILLILRFFLSVIFIIIQIKFIYIIGASSISSITLVVISLIYREYTIWRFYSYFIFQIPTLGVTYNMSLLPFKSSLVNQLPNLNTVWL